MLFRNHFLSCPPFILLFIENINPEVYFYNILKEYSITSWLFHFHNYCHWFEGGKTFTKFELWKFDWHTGFSND